MSKLLAFPGVNPSAADNDPLVAACDGGHLDIARILLHEYSVDASAPSNAPLESACKYGKLEVCSEARTQTHTGLVGRTAFARPEGKTQQLGFGDRECCLLWALACNRAYFVRVPFR